jgi:FkbM family methyltransferase
MKPQHLGSCPLWIAAAVCSVCIGCKGEKQDEVVVRQPIEGVTPTTSPSIPCPTVTPNARSVADATRNDVDATFLQPALLDDRAEMQSYLASLPREQYKEYAIPTLGKVYLDDKPDVIKDVLKRGGRWEPNIERVLETYVKPGSTVIDAGAHIGTHSLGLSRFVGPDGRVFAFEPQRKLYRELVYNLRLNGITNVIPLRFALGDHADVVEMSPAVKGNEGGTGVGTGGDKAELRALDSVPFTNVSVIKIDVEGFEDHVLDGARLTIARWRPVIVIEIQGGQPYEKAPPEIKAKIDATKAKLNGMGYRVNPVPQSRTDYLALPNESPPRGGAPN